nr:unnamed protein product [Callosobruchus chinensis]
MFSSDIQQPNFICGLEQRVNLLVIIKRFLRTEFPVTEDHRRSSNTSRYHSPRSSSIALNENKTVLK